MRFSTSLFTLAVAVVGVIASPVVKRDAATIEADIATIGTQITVLNNAINAFTTGGTLAQGLAVHTASGKLDTAVKAATAAAAATPSLSEDDGTTILNSVQTLETGILTALTNISGLKAKFTALPVGNLVALVKADLNTLNADTVAFENALIALSPADLLDQANTIASNINAGFASAQAAYA
ncbi:hydrophobic surface binding protein [Rickenella mellea]|uniref:Hydrophobic surface binding protein n=1 Tax=Rickenella mellea TaxID=50990 RepID=A0A4Y7Q7D0_9AGAM|nr:hydrophobic surface binding protein [Rickenella mellea]